MALSKFSSTERLLLARSITFFFILVLNAWTLNVANKDMKILCICNISKLGIEHILGVIPLVKSSTLSRCLGILILDITLCFAWLVNASLRSYQIVQREILNKIDVPREELAYGWMIVVFLIIYILLGAKQARMENTRVVEEVQFGSKEYETV